MASRGSSAVVMMIPVAAVIIAIPVRSVVLCLVSVGRTLWSIIRPQIACTIVGPGRWLCPGIARLILGPGDRLLIGPSDIGLEQEKALAARAVAGLRKTGFVYGTKPAGLNKPVLAKLGPNPGQRSG